MVKASLALLAICCIIFIGCSSPDTVPDGPFYNGSKFMPLTVGNYWIYRVQAFKDDGTQLVDVPDTLIAVKKDTVYGIETYSIKENRLNTYVYYFDGDTTFQLQVVSSSDTLRSILGVNSMNDGDQVVLMDVVKPDKSIFRDILRQDSSKSLIKTGFEDFTCFKIRELGVEGTTDIPDTTTVLVSYYAPRKGLIRTETYFKSNNTGHIYLASTMDLTSYYVQ